MRFDAIEKLNFGQFNKLLWNLFVHDEALGIIIGQLWVIYTTIIHMNENMKKN